NHYFTSFASVCQAGSESFKVQIISLSFPLYNFFAFSIFHHSLLSRSLIRVFRRLSSRSVQKNPSTTMTRGNQREKDRERAQSRTGGSKGKPVKTDGLTPEQRRERDAKALQEKTAKKAAQDAGGNNAGGSKK
uniref:Uncharacterized protein LOC101513572 n=2 Tax=Cicer arietinum TaxID=3827 RepID=A0A1S2Z1Y1_CICAR